MPSGCGEIVSTRFPAEQPARRRVNREGRQALRAVAAGAREDDVQVGDAGVGDPRLLAVEHVRVAVAPRASSRARRRRIRPRAPRARRRRCSGPVPRSASSAASAPRCRTARSARCPGPASQTRSPRAPSDTPASRAPGRAFARRARRAYRRTRPERRRAATRHPRAHAPTPGNSRRRCARRRARWRSPTQRSQRSDERPVLVVEERAASCRPASSRLRTRAGASRRRPRRRGESRWSPCRAPVHAASASIAASSGIAHSSCSMRLVIACAQRRAGGELAREGLRALLAALPASRARCRIPTACASAPGRARPV